MIMIETVNAPKMLGHVLVQHMNRCKECKHDLPCEIFDNILTAWTKACKANTIK